MIAPRRSSRAELREDLKGRLLAAAHAAGAARPEFVCFPRARPGVLSPEALRALAGCDAGTPVEPLALDTVLAAMGAADHDVRRLRRVLRANLIDLRAWRIAGGGAWIVGEAPMGGVAGLVLDE